MVATVQDLAQYTLTDPSSELTASFVPGAGMVGLSLKDGDVELLGQRGGLESYLDAGKTIGLPLLYPWANRLSRTSFTLGSEKVDLDKNSDGVRLDSSGLPIHGLLAGVSGWTVTEPASPETETDELAATFNFGAHPELLRSFPFPHTVEIRATLRQRKLTISTTVAADQGWPVPLGYGYHPYFQLPDSPRSQWRLELPAMRRIEVDEQGIPSGGHVQWDAREFPLANLELDHGFDGVADGSVFSLSSPERRINVRFESGFPAVQIFAPKDADLIAIEPMKAPTNALVSGQGLEFLDEEKRDTAVFSISVS